MKHGLLLGVAVLALAIAVPASAQYVYLDTNGDGVCNSLDVLSSSTTSIDFYIDTNLDSNGNPVTCPTGEDLTINSYAITVSASGGVTYGAWTDNMGFGIAAGGAQAGNDFWVARASGTPSVPGSYKVGSLAVTVSGTPTMTILPTDPTLDPTSLTAFGSLCPGIDFDNTLKLGSDFFDVCSSSAGTATEYTTWGKIKKMYGDPTK